MLTWIKRQVRDYFGFSKTETNGVFVLVLCIATCLVTPITLRWYYRRQPLDHTLDAALLDSLVQELNQQAAFSQAPRQVKTPTNSSFKQKPRPSAHSISNPFNINAATTQQLQRIEGIDHTLALRIIRYREQLGGFISQKQYLEIYGCSELLCIRLAGYTYITPDFQPKQLNINTADFKTLLAHPYLNYAQVKRIMRFKTIHKQFNKLEDLAELQILDETTFFKIKPYLKIEPAK